MMLPTKSPYIWVILRISVNPQDILYGKAACFLEAADTFANGHASDTLPEIHIPVPSGLTAASK